MRLFVALDIDESARLRFAEFQDRLRLLAPKTRWASVDGLHITLKFLGEQPDVNLEAIAAALQSIRAQSFSFRLSGCGFFPDPAMARVFWAGVTAGPDLIKLANAVHQALAIDAAGLNISRQLREFHPHLTLARSGSGRPFAGPGEPRQNAFAALQLQLACEQPLEFATVVAREFYLYESLLGPDGSVYQKRAAFKLL